MNEIQQTLRNLPPSTSAACGISQADMSPADIPVDFPRSGVTVSGSIVLHVSAEPCAGSSYTAEDTTDQHECPKCLVRVASPQPEAYMLCANLTPLSANIHTTYTPT